MTITRPAPTRSTPTTRAPSRTQITEPRLQVASYQSSGAPVFIDTQANECVDVSEFYLSRLILYMAFHMLSSIVHILYVTSTQLCVRYGCENICSRET